MSAPWLAIVGIGEDGHLPPEAAALVRGAGLVMGGARHLALAADAILGEARRWPSPIGDAVPMLLARRGQPTAVLASGDPLWFGIAATLLRHLPAEELRVLPSPSAFALAAARLGWPIEATACLSCCGRPLAALVPHLQDGARLLVLSADADTPGAVAALLDAHGFGASRLRVLEHLGGPAERLHDGVPDRPAALNLLAIEARGPGLPLVPGRPDDAFEHDGQISKSEIRAVVIAALDPRPGQMLWDVGAGSGAVGIEWMLAHPSCRAIAIEARPDRADRIRRNRETLGVPALTVIEGQSPGALDGLPPPDAVFLGGGIEASLAPALAALRPGGRMVANAVTLPAEAALIAAQARHGGTLLRIGVERLDRVGPYPAYRPGMTVTQWRLVVPPRTECAAVPPPGIVAGIGLRAVCDPDAVIELVHQAELATGLTVAALAAPARKRGHAALERAAARLGLPLLFVDDADLAAMQAACPTRSGAALAATGHASIAEACALAASGGRLLLPRIANATATCAVAAP